VRIEVFQSDRKAPMVRDIFPGRKNAKEGGGTSKIVLRKVCVMSERCGKFGLEILGGK